MVGSYGYQVGGYGPLKPENPAEVCNSLVLRIDLLELQNDVDPQLSK
jgi:hypothetical protein